MANTYTQLHIHTIFAVQYRRNLIVKEWKDKLYKYITGIIQKNGHKVLQINGVEDHVHILIGMNPNQSLSQLMKIVKKSSTDWINKQRLTKGKFKWQAGYGAFAHSKSQVPRVIKYIQNQEEHHKRKTFREEYIEILKTLDIEYDERYIFKSPV